MKESLRSRGWQLVRYLLGVVALLWVVSRGQWEESLDTLASVSPLTVTILLVFVVSGLLFRFLTWYAFIQPETPIRFRTAAEIDLIVNFLNQLLPSRLSGRAAAPLVVSQRTGLNVGTSIGVTGINTAIYAIMYGVVSGFGLFLLGKALSLGILIVISVSTVLYLVSGTVLLVSGLNATAVDTLTERLIPVVARLPGVGSSIVAAFDRVPDFTEQSIGVFRRTLGSPSAIGLYVIGWIGSAALFPTFRVAILFDAFGSPFTPLVTLPAVLVAAYSVTLLPLTPGGIGVTEATAAAVFVSLGVPYEIAAATILVDRVLGVYLPALLGWYPIIHENPLTLKTK